MPSQRALALIEAKQTGGIARHQLDQAPRSDSAPVNQIKRKTKPGFETDNPVGAIAEYPAVMIRVQNEAPVLKTMRELAHLLGGWIMGRVIGGDDVDRTVAQGFCERLDVAMSA